MTSLSTPQVVAVIATPADLQYALRMRRAPDLFEVRLDALFARREELISTIGRLRAPLIVTARHPREGGSNQLSSQDRRALLRRFLPYAAYVDIELRSAGRFAPILKEARTRGIRIIVSFHDFQKTPSGSRLEAIAGNAQSLGADLFKIVTRTDTPVQLARLLDLFQRKRREMNIAAMGVGRLGRISRLRLTRRSALSYGHLGKPQVEGQLSLAQLRRILQ